MWGLAPTYTCVRGLAPTYTCVRGLAPTYTCVWGLAPTYTCVWGLAPTYTCVRARHLTASPRHAAPPAMRQAIRSASTVEEGLARPLPAMSKAVP